MLVFDLIMAPAVILAITGILICAIKSKETQD